MSLHSCLDGHVHGPSPDRAKVRHALRKERKVRIRHYDLLEGADVGTVLLREKQKERRRQHILDATEALIRESNSTDFTMLELAKRASISPTTAYNLFGSKGAVLYSLLNRALDSLIQGGEVAAAQDDPVEHPVMTMAHAADFFIGDPGLFRPLYKFQLGEQALMDRPLYMDRALDLWRRSLDGLVKAGQITAQREHDGFSRDDIAAALLTHSIGVLELWVQEEVCDAEFRARMMHDAALLIFAIVDDAGRKKLMEIIRRCRPQMSSEFSFQKHAE